MHAHTQALLTIDTLDKEAAHELARDMYTLGFTRRSVYLAYGQALLHMMKSRYGGACVPKKPPIMASEPSREICPSRLRVCVVYAVRHYTNPHMECCVFGL